MSPAFRVRPPVEGWHLAVAGWGLLGGLAYAPWATVLAVVALALVCGVLRYLDERRRLFGGPARRMALGRAWREVQGAVIAFGLGFLFGRLGAAMIFA